MRCADLGPIPGSRPSSSIRSWTAAAYIVRPTLPTCGAGPDAALTAAEQPLRPEQAAEPPPRSKPRGPRRPRRGPARPRRARRPGSGPAASRCRPGSTTDGSMITSWNSRPRWPAPDGAPPALPSSTLAAADSWACCRFCCTSPSARQQGTEIGNGLLFAAHGDTSSAPGNASSRRCSGES